MSGPRFNLTPAERTREWAAEWRRIAPLLLALACALVVTAPVFGPAPLAPHLPLLMLVVWSLHQPRLMPPAAALLVGLATDLALDLPPGVNATLMPLAAIALRTAGTALGARGFWTDWLLALPAIALYQAIAFALLTLGGPPRDGTLLVGQTLATWLLFPAAARLTAWTMRAIVRA